MAPNFSTKKIIGYECSECKVKYMFAAPVSEYESKVAYALSHSCRGLRMPQGAIRLIEEEGS